MKNRFQKREMQIKERPVKLMQKLYGNMKQNNRAKMKNTRMKKTNCHKR